MCSVAGQCDPVVWVFSTGGFHGLFATKPVSSETGKAERRSNGDHSSIWDSWPTAFSGKVPRAKINFGDLRYQEFAHFICRNHFVATVLAL